MNLTPELLRQGFALCDVTPVDLDAYIDVKRACYRKYVDEYYGGWVEEVQISMNTNIFNEAAKTTCFKKLLLKGETAGFFSHDELDDRIDGITIQMLEATRNRGVGSFYLRHIIGISDRTGKPIYLKVFKTNPAQSLYRQFGFMVYDEIETHFLMKYQPQVL